MICEECGYADYIHDDGVICEVERAIRKDEREIIIKRLDAEKLRSRIGFIQYGVLLDIIQGGQK